MNDKFQNRSTGYTGPATHAREFTPSDAVGLADIPRWLTVNVGGTLVVDMLDNTDAENPVSIPAQAGDLTYIRVKKIHATGTTATGIVGYW